MLLFILTSFIICSFYDDFHKIYSTISKYNKQSFTFAINNIQLLSYQMYYFQQHNNNNIINNNKNQ